MSVKHGYIREKTSAVSLAAVADNAVKSTETLAETLTASVAKLPVTINGYHTGKI